MARLLLVRHGQASYGQLDYDRLSPRGEDQARALGRFLSAQKLDALFVGPLRRQLDTVARAAEAGPLPAATQLPGLAEYPAFEHVTKLLPRLTAEDPAFAAMPSRELADRAFQTILGRWSRDEWSADGVERVAAFVARVRGALDGVLDTARSGGRVAVVTSAGPIGVAVGLAFGVDAERMVRTSRVVRNASITELVFRTGSPDPELAWHPDRLSLLAFNAVGHLPVELHTDY